MNAGGGVFRIGELARRVGVTPDRLRAWEKRYGLLRPTRSAGGYRLYSEDDERRVRVMLAQLRGGLAPAEAAAVARGPLATPAEDSAKPETLERLRSELSGALDDFEGPAAHGALDQLLARFSIEAALQWVILPYLHDLGERWARREVSVAQEHFASRLLEARMLALARGWERGPGRPAVLACAPAEQHTLGLVAFGLALRNYGWVITYLGADSPVEMVREAVRARDARLAVVSAVDVSRFADVIGDLRGLAGETRLLVAGAGATEPLRDRLGAERLNLDPVEAARSLAA